MKLILASGSPRRREILKEMGRPFEVILPHVEENHPPHLSPEESAVENALAKARWVSQRAGDAILIGADTVVALGNDIFNKPRDESEAVRMLAALSGKTHRVITGMAFLVVREGRIIDEINEHVVTRVTMRSIPYEDIRNYVKEHAPFDKAGAYAIQEIGDRFVERIEGDYYNVVGLPKERVMDILNALFRRY
jgi:septum formation protein